MSHSDDVYGASIGVPLNLFHSKDCVCLPLAESLFDRLVMLGWQIQAITAQLVGSIFECIVFGGLDFGN